MDWPIESIAEVLVARVNKRSPTHYVLRWENRGLGVKLMLDIDTATNNLRVVVDRISRLRPTFIGSLDLMGVVDFELDREHLELVASDAFGQSLALTAGGSFQFNRST